MLTKSIIRVTFIYMVILMCCALYHISDLGFMNGSSYERITYMFSHANLIHLGINILGFFVMYNLLKNTIFIYTQFIFAYIATFGSEMAIPTVGLSGCVYAMFGSLFYYLDKQGKIRLGFTSLLCNLIMLVGGNVNVMLHLLSFVYSLLFTYIYGTIRKRIELQRASRA